MNDLKNMLESHPKGSEYYNPSIQECVNDIFMCADFCIICADACLNEEMVSDLRNCIKLNQDCADICEAAGKILLRGCTGNKNLIKKQLEACETACHICHAECSSHADKHEHCKLCAEMCEKCLKSCKKLLAEF